MKINIKKFDPRNVLIVLLICALAVQIGYLLLSSKSTGYVKAQAGGKITSPQFHPDKLQGRPPKEGRIEPPPPGTGGEHSGPDAGQAPPPGAQGPKSNSYPSIPQDRELTDREFQIIQTRFVLHRWVLSDLMWGIRELETGNKHRLTAKQIRKIYPAVKALADSVEIVKKSDTIARGLLTDRQKQFIKDYMNDRAKMEALVARYPATRDAEPIFGASFVIYDKAEQIIKERAAGYKDAKETKDSTN